MSTAIRLPAVAGKFYPADSGELRAEVEAFTRRAESAEQAKIRAFGCVAPHAGYVYSGTIAGEVYRRIELPARYIILCPNHTGRGEPLAIMSQGAWRTPLGDVPIDEGLASELKARLSLLAEDEAAHRFEHALEVQLPFLQVMRPRFNFVPITVGSGHYEVLSALGVAIASVIGASGGHILVIASSDMNHYERDSVTRAKDKRAIDQILALDPRGLYDVVREANISMCGYGPTVAMLTAALRLGAAKTELLGYATSGDVSGDRDTVVGYAGIAIS
jgi:MEMO1 family protein